MVKKNDQKHWNCHQDQASLQRSFLAILLKEYPAIRAQHINKVDKLYSHSGTDCKLALRFHLFKHINAENWDESGSRKLLEKTED